MPVSETPSARILVVDDEAAQMKALCDTLRDHGYETTGFLSGRAALSALRGSRFDLLLADLMMPEMDGIALLQAALETDPGLVGIIMTGEGTIATAVDAMKAGAFDYILKPFKLSVILPVLSRALEMRRLRLDNEELQQRLRDRAAELEAANSELDAFSHSVSHDLRAPLRAVAGYSRILLEESGAQLPERDLLLLRHIIAGAEQMGRLIDGLLNLSRLGRQALAKRPVNISALVQEVLQEMHEDQDGRQVEVRAGDLPDCIGDPSLLKQVFVNLLSNAFKYTRHREKAMVGVGCTQQDGANTYFVRDNGAGFDMRYADKLFVVFQRLHASNEFEGTGIGLSIVHRIVRRHGGRIWAEAEVDKGATFYFTLPG